MTETTTTAPTGLAALATHLKDMSSTVENATPVRVMSDQSRAASTHHDALVSADRSREYPAVTTDYLTLAADYTSDTYTPDITARFALFPHGTTADLGPAAGELNARRWKTRMDGTIRVVDVPTGVVREVVAQYLPDGERVQRVKVTSNTITDDGQGQVTLAVHVTPAPRSASRVSAKTQPLQRRIPITTRYVTADGDVVHEDSDTYTFTGSRSGTTETFTKPRVVLPEITASPYDMWQVTHPAPAVELTPDSGPARRVVEVTSRVHSEKAVTYQVMVVQRIVLDGCEYTTAGETVPVEVPVAVGGDGGRYTDPQGVITTAVREHVAAASRTVTIDRVDIDVADDAHATAIVDCVLSPDTARTPSIPPAPTAAESGEDTPALFGVYPPGFTSSHVAAPFTLSADDSARFVDVSRAATRAVAETYRCDPLLLPESDPAAAERAVDMCVETLSRGKPAPSPTQRAFATHMGWGEVTYEQLVPRKVRRVRSLSDVSTVARIGLARSPHNLFECTHVWAGVLVEHVVDAGGGVYDVAFSVHTLWFTR